MRFYAVSVYSDTDPAVAMTAKPKYAITSDDQRKEMAVISNCWDQMSGLDTHARPVSAYRIEQAMTAWQATRARLLSDDGDLAHDEAALIELLGSEAGDIKDVLARLLRGSVHAGAMANAASDQMETLQGRRDRYKRREEAMRATAYAIFDALGLPKLELPDLTASIRVGQPRVIITDEDAIPDIYVEVVTTRKPDKAVILSVLKSGGEVPGCEKTNGIPSLAIRTK